MKRWALIERCYNRNMSDRTSIANRMVIHIHLVKFCYPPAYLHTSNWSFSWGQLYKTESKCAFGKFSIKFIKIRRRNRYRCNLTIVAVSFIWTRIKFRLCFIHHTYLYYGNQKVNHLMFHVISLYCIYINTSVFEISV